MQSSEIFRDVLLEIEKLDSGILLLDIYLRQNKVGDIDILFSRLK